MTVLFGVFLLILLVITAVAVVKTRNLVVAVMLLGIFSLLIAINESSADAQVRWGSDPADPAAGGALAVRAGRARMALLALDGSVDASSPNQMAIAA